MHQYQCDGCGKMLEEQSLRYSVTIDVRAAYSEMEVGLADLVRDHRREILDLLEQLRHRHPSEVEEQVYKKLKLDLCPECQRVFIRDPLNFQKESEPSELEIDIDQFLRSLGFGQTKQEE